MEEIFKAELRRRRRACLCRDLRETVGGTQPVPVNTTSGNVEKTLKLTKEEEEEKEDKREVEWAAGDIKGGSRGTRSRCMAPGCILVPSRWPLPAGDLSFS